MRITWLVIGLLAMPALAVETMFVHATNLNLRAAPNATAKVLALIPIGASCDISSRSADGWAEMKCLGMVGHAKVDLLGAKAPTAPFYGLEAIAKSKPIGARLLAAGRALALKPTVQIHQDRFRKVFIEAEWNRLDVARQKKQLLNPTVVITPTSSCADANACIDAALKPDVAGVSTIVILRGNDFLHGLLWPDGVFRLRSGSYANKNITIELESSSVPSRVVMVALQLTPVNDVCAFPMPSEVDWPTSAGALCGHEYDQNCGPDAANCFQNDQDCEERAGMQCATCKVDCGGTCNSCRSQCAQAAPAARASCVASCSASKDVCAASCQQPFTVAKASCDATSKICDDALELRCKASCDTLYACLTPSQDNYDSCWAKHKPNTAECAEHCTRN